MKKLGVVLAICCVTGCTAWAPEGRGGFAENELNLLAWMDTDDNRELGPEHGLRFEVAVSKNHLDVLVLEGAELCFPASVEQARLQQNRIVRELEGGLTVDAATDLEVQVQFLNMLEKRLDIAKSGGACRVAGIGQQNGLVQGLSEALNSNNQFAFDSSELTPAYRDQLKSLMPLLISSKLAVQITGHSDAFGNDSHKQKISQQRANTVASFMREHGLDDELVSVFAAADQQPYEPGESADVRHSNRRVTIQLTDAQ